MVGDFCKTLLDESPASTAAQQAPGVLAGKMTGQSFAPAFRDEGGFSLNRQVFSNLSLYCLN
jgi:hypothetical protein